MVIGTAQVSAVRAALMAQLLPRNLVPGWQAEEERVQAQHPLIGYYLPFPMPFGHAKHETLEASQASLATAVPSLPFSVKLLLKPSNPPLRSLGMWNSARLVAMLQMLSSRLRSKEFGRYRLAMPVQQP